MSRHPEAIISVAGQESVWDYPRPPRIESVSERIVVRFAGETIADTYRALRIVETSHPPVYYLPPQDMPFCLQEKGITLRESIEAYRRKAEGNCLVDVAFHLIVTDPSPQVLGQELPALIAEGFTSIKIFMTYDDLKLADREILEVLSVAQQHRALVMEGAKYVCSPPPRDLDSQKACWEGLQQGVFEVFSSDHCPFRYDDPAGKMAPRGKTNFRYVPNGIPGIATRMTA